MLAEIRSFALDLPVWLQVVAVGVVVTAMVAVVLVRREHRHRLVGDNLAYADVSLADRLLRRWLLIVKGHPWMVHLGTALLIASVSIVALRLLGLDHTEAQALAVEIPIVLTSLMVPPVLTVLALRRPIIGIVRLASISRPAATDVLLRLITAQLAAVIHDLGDLQKQGMVLTTQLVPEWVHRSCWACLGGMYTGTDSNVPSAYLLLYEDYLQSHAQYITRTKRTDSCRIIFANEDDIRSDHTKNLRQFDLFVKWHVKHGVQLLRLDRNRAKRLAKELNTGDATDMAAWKGELVLIWRYSEDRQHVFLCCAFVGEPLYDRCMAFLTAVKSEAVPFPS